MCSSDLALDESDVVIQPAIDGGYTLIGMNQFHEDLFAKMPWSTERLFQASLDVLKSMDITYSLLELQRDIDTLDDLHIWLNNGGRQMLEKVMPGWELGL